MEIGQEHCSITPNKPEHSLMTMQLQPSYYGGLRGFNNTRLHGRSTHGCGLSSNWVCTHCGQTNHVIDMCFMKHGYSHGYHKKN